MISICDTSRWSDDIINFTENVNDSSWTTERVREGEMDIRRYGKCHVELHEAIDPN